MTPEVRKSFGILEVRLDSSPAEVRTAYHELVKIWHPDRFDDERLRRRANDKLKLLNRAYRLIQEFHGHEHPARPGICRDVSIDANPDRRSADAGTFAGAGGHAEEGGEFRVLGEVAEAYLQGKLSEARFLIGAVQSALARPDSQIPEMLALTFGQRGEVAEVSSEDPDWLRSRCLSLPARCGLRARVMISPARRFLCIPGTASRAGGIVEIRVPGGGFTWSVRRNESPEFVNVPLGGLGPFLYDQLRADAGGATRLQAGSPWASCRERLGRALAAGLETLGRSVVPLKSTIESVMSKTAEDAMKELGRIGRVEQEPGRAIRVVPQVDQLTGEVALDAFGQVSDGVIDYADGESVLRFQLWPRGLARAVPIPSESTRWSLSQTGKMTSVDHLAERELARHFR